jgi:ABC-type lipoprotein release transport system permease subunit
MRFRHVLAAVFQNIRRNRRSFALSSVGLVIGVATLTFFVHLGLGIQDGVLNRIYPVNQIEFEPRTVGVMGMRQDVLAAERLDTNLVADFEGLPDVVEVFPKQRSKFQARLWGGQAIFGYAARTEAFFDGLDPGLVIDEVKARELEDAAPAVSPRARSVCKVDEECRLGFRCGEGGRCEPSTYWERFSDRGVAEVCKDDDGCAAGKICRDGLCAAPCGDGGACPEGLACVADLGICQRPCRADPDCPDAHRCALSGQEGVCERLACTLEKPEDQLLDSPVKLAGTVTNRCANGVPPEDPACVRSPCPSGTYCAPRGLVTAEGYCEHPIPVLLSPVLMEIFNSSAAVSLGMQKIDGLQALLGVQFMMQFGNSYFAANLPVELQLVKRTEIVGFSEKALELGVTMPLAYVQSLNARFKGQAASTAWDTLIVQTAGNEDVSRLIRQAEAWGLALSRKSEDARKAGDLLFILTIVFSFISLVILFVAGVNIAHTFLTLVTERRHEIGIMRAIGASRADIRRLFLTEAVVLGAFGGVLGNLLSWGATRLANAVAQSYLADVPFRPDDFFVYDWRVVVGGIAFACVFCLLGAAVPARKASRLDPAVVLSS